MTGLAGELLRNPLGGALEPTRSYLQGHIELHLRLTAGLSSWVYSGPVKHLGNQEEGRHPEPGF